MSGHPVGPGSIESGGFAPNRTGGDWSINVVIGPVILAGIDRQRGEAVDDANQLQTQPADRRRPIRPPRSAGCPAGSPSARCWWHRADGRCRPHTGQAVTGPRRRPTTSSRRHRRPGSAPELLPDGRATVHRRRHTSAGTSMSEFRLSTPPVAGDVDSFTRPIRARGVTHPTSDTARRQPGRSTESV